jgi:hypothetical protein
MSPAKWLVALTLDVTHYMQVPPAEVLSASLEEGTCVNLAPEHPDPILIQFSQWLQPNQTGSRIGSEIWANLDRQIRSRLDHIPY